MADIWTFAFNFVLSFLDTMGFAVIYNAPKRELINCGIAGALGWVVYFYIMGETTNSTLSVFGGSIVVSACSRVLSYTRRAPSTLFLIPGIIPLVPGYPMYNTMLAMIEQDLYHSYLEGVGTLQMAGAIAIGIVFIFSLPYRAFAWVAPKDERKKRKK